MRVRGGVGCRDLDLGLGLGLLGYDAVGHSAAAAEWSVGEGGVEGTRRWRRSRVGVGYIPVECGVLGDLTWGRGGGRRGVGRTHACAAECVRACWQHATQHPCPHRVGCDGNHVGGESYPGLKGLGWGGAAYP